MIPLGIYRHYKGDLYKVTQIAYDHEIGFAHAIYHKCDENGIFKSIRKSSDPNERPVNQPFIRMAHEFNNIVNYDENNNPITRFKFIKS